MALLLFFLSSYEHYLYEFLDFVYEYFDMGKDHNCTKADQLNEVIFYALQESKNF